MTALEKLCEAAEAAADHLHASYRDMRETGCDAGPVTACPVETRLREALDAVRAEKPVDVAEWLEDRADKARGKELIAKEAGCLENAQMYSNWKEVLLLTARTWRAEHKESAEQASGQEAAACDKPHQWKPADFAESCVWCEMDRLQAEVVRCDTENHAAPSPSQEAMQEERKMIASTLKDCDCRNEKHRYLAESVRRGDFAPGRR
jgi:hypothetical protein